MIRIFNGLASKAVRGSLSSKILTGGLHFDSRNSLSSTVDDSLLGTSSRPADLLVLDSHCKAVGAP